MTNKVSSVLVVLAIAGCVNFLVNVKIASGADRLRIGLSSFTPINASLWIAEDKGLQKIWNRV
jgi:hypothetical protein